MLNSLIINIFTSAIVLLATNVITHVLLKNNYDLFALVFAFIILSIIWIVKEYFRDKKAFLAAQAFDYKFYANQDNYCISIKKILNMFGFAECGAVSDIPEMLVATRKDYISSTDFFNPKNSYLNQFSCHALRNKDKKGKIILQLSYLPVDKDGKTLLIQRKPEYHPSFFLKSQRAKKLLAFISFSPIPTNYGIPTFSPSDGYYNEVPKPWGSSKGLKLDVKELGAIIRKDQKRDTIYLFYAYKVTYPVSFTNLDGSLVDLKELFYASTEAYKRHVAFYKDHDKIMDAVDLNTLKEWCFYRKLPKLNCCFWSKQFWKTIYVRYFLKRMSIMAVENTILRHL